MKILISSHTGDLAGGAERSLLDIFDVLSARGTVTPTFILREPLGSMVRELRQRNWRFHPLKFTFWCWPAPRDAETILTQSLENRRAVADIESLIVRIKPDMVLTNTIVSPWAALAAYAQQIPHVWFVREYGDSHGLNFEMSREETFRDIGNLSNLVVANSDTLSNHIRHFIDPEKVTTLYTPFDLASIAQKAKVEVKNPFRFEDSLKLIFTAHFAEDKGQLDAVNAVSELQQGGLSVELCLVGRKFDRTYAREVESTIRRLGLTERVHVVGPKRNVLPLIALSDVGVMASRAEAFSRAVFEYMALGKPTVGADSGGIPELVKDGINGFLYPVGDSRALASAVLRYLQNSNLRAEHGEAALIRAAASVSTRWNVASLQKRLEVVVSGQGQPKGGPVRFLEHWHEQQQRAELLAPARQRSIRYKIRRLAKHGKYRARNVKSYLTGR
jgi:glycosyltransferase involved in cell wall biosynthesis